MRISILMKELYNNYYKDGLSQSSSQNVDIKSFERMARKYRWNYQRFFSRMNKSANILDLGCGVGQFLFYLKKYGFDNLTGIDISNSQIDLALKMQPQINFLHVEDSVDFLLNKHEEYDVIVLNDVLEHIAIAEIIPFLNALNHSLKPDGQIVIKTINSAYPLSNASRYLDPTHTTSFHQRSLTQLLRHTGFIDIHCYQEEIGLYNPLFIAKKLIVYFVRFLLRTLVYFSESDWPGIISVNLIVSGRKQ
jgi:2-polyprenyl-3-methyl-5-hydroxy-6-metoxy-1,4-benzoquinol methylase